MENAGRLRNGRAPKRPTIENDHPTSSLDNDKSRHPDSTTHIRNTPLYIYIHTHTHTYTYKAYTQKQCELIVSIGEGSPHVRIFDKLPFREGRGGVTLGKWKLDAWCPEESKRTDGSMERVSENRRWDRWW